MHKIIMLLALAAILTSWGCTHNSPSGKPAAYHYQRGLSYLGEKNYSAALQDLGEAEKLDPNNPELLYSLGQAYMGKRRPDLAEMKFQMALKLRPNYSQARNDLGVVYMDMKRWDSAIQQFKLVKDDLLYEQHDNAVINLGLSYLGKGEYQQAFDELNALRSLAPRNPLVRVALGRVLFAQDKQLQAIIEYRRALEIYPDYAAAHYYLGMSLMKSNLVAARAAFREAARIVPDSEIGRSSMEYLELLK